MVKNPSRPRRVTVRSKKGGTLCPSCSQALRNDVHICCQGCSMSGDTGGRCPSQLDSVPCAAIAASTSAYFQCTSYSQRSPCSSGASTHGLVSSRWLSSRSSAPSKNTLALSSHRSLIASLIALPGNHRHNRPYAGRLTQHRRLQNWIHVRPRSAPV